MFVDMINEADLNILVSNVVSENLNKHCRLCLKEIAENDMLVEAVSEKFIKFNDYVSYDGQSFFPLNHILLELLGRQILEEIPGVDVVCPCCVQKTLECCRFIHESKKASEILNKTFHNLSEALSVDLDVKDNFQRLYVVIGKEESVLILVDKDGNNKDVLKNSPQIQVKDFNLICNQCSYLAGSKKELKDHKMNVHNLNCLHCKKSFQSEESSKQHQELVHTERVCKECGKSFNDSKKLSSHKEEHKAKDSNVPDKTIVASRAAEQSKMCGNLNNSKKPLTHEEGQKAKGSNVPEKTTKLHQSAHRQKIEEPKDKTPLLCKECGKTCLGLEKLQAHEERHSSKSECPKCGKVYLTRDFYMKHVELCLAEKLEAHPFRAKMEKKYRCDECDKRYSCQSGLNVHKKFVHGNFKGHICEICGKIFSAPSYLKTHMVKHTGEKKFTCNVCPKNFVSKEALLYHTRRHTGEKPYCCNVCNERFVNASARAEHIKYKHQSPQFPCDICNKMFFTTSFLKQHHKRHSDPLSKLFMGRSGTPANKPLKQNMRLKAIIAIENTIDSSEEEAPVL